MGPGRLAEVRCAVPPRNTPPRGSLCPTSKCPSPQAARRAGSGRVRGVTLQTPSPPRSRRPGFAGGWQPGNPSWKFRASLLQEDAAPQRPPQGSGIFGAFLVVLSCYVWDFLLEFILFVSCEALCTPLPSVPWPIRGYELV